MASTCCVMRVPIDRAVGHPFVRSRARECATRARSRTMTTPMEMFHAMQAKLRESSREYETIAEGARR